MIGFESRILLLRVRALEVDPVLFILFAGVGHNLRILALNGQRDGPRLGIKLGILECHRPLDVVFIDRLKALHQMQLIAVLVAGRVEPSTIVEPDCVDDQSVAFPMTDGIAKPGLVRILGMAATVSVDDAEGALILEEEGHDCGSLNDLERHKTGLDSARRPDGQTLRQGIVDFVFFLKEIGGIGRKGRLMAQRLRDIGSERRRPDTI